MLFDRLLAARVRGVRPAPRCRREPLDLVEQDRVAGLGCFEQTLARARLGRTRRIARVLLEHLREPEPQVGARLGAFRELDALLVEAGELLRVVLSAIHGLEDLGRLLEEIALFSELFEQDATEPAGAQAHARAPSATSRRRPRRVPQVLDLELREPMVVAPLGSSASNSTLTRRSRMSRRPCRQLLGRDVKPIERGQELGLIARLLDRLLVGVDRSLLVAEPLLGDAAEPHVQLPRQLGFEGRDGALGEGVGVALPAAARGLPRGGRSRRADPPLPGAR